MISIQLSRALGFILGAGAEFGVEEQLLTRQKAGVGSCPTNLLHQE